MTKSSGLSEQILYDSYLPEQSKEIHLTHPTNQANISPRIASSTNPISRLRYLLERSQILCLSEPSAALTQTHEAAASITLEAEQGPKDNREWPDLKMLIAGSHKSFCFGLSSRLCCLSGQAPGEGKVAKCAVSHLVVSTISSHRDPNDSL